MSDRLDQLAQRLTQMCEGRPIDVTQEEPTLVLMAKCQAESLAKAFQAQGDTEKRQESMEAALNVSNVMAEAIGENHQAVKILRGMHLIAKAILAGEPEPGDEELGLTSKCFVATACYGTPDCREVRRLRAFRDDVLLGSASGKLFVAVYYRFSPPLAKWLRHRPEWRRRVKECLLVPIVRCISDRYERSNKPDAGDG